MDVGEKDGERKTGREPFFRLYVDDWRSGVRGLSYELQGFYLEILLLMHERHGGIPNDIDELAEHLGKDRRKVRRLVGELIAKGKLMMQGDQLVNRRIERDRLQRQQVSERQAKIARLPRKVSAKSARSLGEVGAKSEQTPVPDVAKSRACASLPDPDPDPDPKGVPIASKESVAPRGELAGLNGSADLMIDDLVAWMFHGDERSAGKWLASTLAQYGQDVTRDSYAKLKADIASGEAIARPIQTWVKIAQRMARDPGDGDGAKPSLTQRQKRDRAFAAKFFPDMLEASHGHH